MALRYRTAGDGHLAVVFASGVVREADLTDLFRQLRAGAALRPSVRILVDATYAEPTLELTDVRSMAERAEWLVAWGVTRVAFVVSHGPTYPLAELFAGYASAAGLEVAVFRGVADATRWLERGSAGSVQACG
jgi:hypothetical protein